MPDQTTHPQLRIGVCEGGFPKLSDRPTSTSDLRLEGLPHCLTFSLTNLAPLGSNAVVEAEVVDLAVAVFYVQLGEAKVNPVAAGHADLPLTHRVVRVRPRVTQRGQSPTAGAKHTGATAITCRTTQAQRFRREKHASIEQR